MISNMVLGLLNQLQIFSQLYLIELLERLTGLGLLKLLHLIYPRLLTGFGMLVFFTNLSHRISGQIFGLWMESVHKNIQLMLEFVKAPFLVIQVSYYTSMTFLTMLSVILLSMLMILLSILSVIRHLICDNNFNWLLNLNLVYKRLWTGVRSGLLILMLGKLSCFPLTGLITVVLLM